MIWCLMVMMMMMQTGAGALAGTPSDEKNEDFVKSNFDDDLMT